MNLLLLRLSKRQVNHEVKTGFSPGKTEDARATNAIEVEAGYQTLWKKRLACSMALLLLTGMTGLIIWIIALWMFGGGGSGIGGPGGLGLGAGMGKGEGERAVEIGKKNSGTDETPAGLTLRIEVLGGDTLSESDFRAKRWYRTETAQGPRLLTFEETKQEVERLKHEQPSLDRIEIVLYKDSLDERIPIVARLRIWVGDLNGGKMKVDISRPDSNAPWK